MYSMPWNKKQKNILEKYLKENKIPNWILFSWEKWIWKFETWKNFAKIILKNKDNFLKNFISIWDIWFEWCDEKNIYKTTNFPQEQRKKRNPKTEKIWIDDIRQIIELDAKIPSWLWNSWNLNWNWKRIFLIKNIERFTHEAQNSFLKILEDSKNSIFICTTKNKNLLLPTIISRFQEIEFFKLSNSEIKDFFKEKNFIWDSQSLEDAIKFSFWKIELAKKILEDKNFLEEQKKSFEENKKFLENIFNKNWKNKFSKIYQKSEFLFKNRKKELNKNQDLIKNEINFLENFLNSKLKWEWKDFFKNEKSNNKKFVEIYENFLKLKKWLKSNQNLKLIFDNFYIWII